MLYLLCITFHTQYSIPNHEFIFNELLELSSFPRRALESLPYEMGAQALSRQNLCIADNMLRGSWARFMHNLFIKLSKPVDNSIILFLSVVTGSLLLQCEDHTVLRSCLATLLTAAMKFSSVFKLSGYQMVVPTLVQVYALHSKNKLVTEAIKFIWVHFYWKSKNRFLLQVIASVTNLISSEVGNLAIVLGANFSPLNVTVNEEEDEDEKLQLVKTLMELLEALNVSYNDLPKDTLDVLVRVWKRLSCRPLHFVIFRESVLQILQQCLQRRELTWSHGPRAVWRSS